MEDSVDKYREMLISELKEAGIKKYGIAVIAGVEEEDGIQCCAAVSGKAVACAQVLWKTLKNVMLSMKPINRSLLIIRILEELSEIENAPSERQP